MVAIYGISIFVFIFYFGIGYKRFQNQLYQSSKVALSTCAIILRVFFFILGNHSSIAALSMIVDLMTGVFIYLIISKDEDEAKGIIGASFYVLNPVILVYEGLGDRSLALWGLLLVLCIYEIQNKRFHYACICFSTALYLYVGTICLVPAFVAMLLCYFKKEHDGKQVKMALGGLVLPFCLFFISGRYLFYQRSQFISELKELFFCERMSYNACNVWGMIGWNQKPIMISLGVRVLIFLGVGLVLCGGTYMFIHRYSNDKRSYLYAAFLGYCFCYLFGIGIRNDMFLPIVLLGLGSFVACGQKKVYGMYVCLSLLGFASQIYSYLLYDPQNNNSMAPSIVLFSFFTVITFVVLVKWLLCDQLFWSDRKMNGEQSEKIVSRKRHKKSEYQDAITSSFIKIGKKDYLVMFGLMLVFISLSLPRLGSLHAPHTTFSMGDEGKREIILDLGEEKEVDHLAIFLGEEHGIKVNISSYDQEQSAWQLIGEEQNVQSVFCWNKVEVDAPMRYLGVVTPNREAYFNELVILDKMGEKITPINADEYPTLFDEQELYKAYPTYYDQTFFDEVYHARTAFEYIKGDISYENTHPPLGKILISLGIRVFGMNPFGWRIVVELFGIAMIPVMYLFAKRLLKSFEAATLTTLLLTMDFMHFTLAKIATLDIIIGFFILLMYFFMYWYCQIDLTKVSLRKSFIPLGLCGITMGLGIATKWTGVYAGAGLAILFFVHMWQFYIKSKEAHKDYLEKLIKTFGFCVIFFIVIPAAIYCLSYIPFVGYRAYNGLLDKVFDNMKTMFDYHSKLTATHPYESWWYEWPWIKRPLFQAVTHGPNGMGSAISCFGNPLVWWPGMLAVLYNFKCWLWDKDRKAGFLCISYAAQLIPWMFVTRNTFIYHYFPASLFMILMIGYCLYKIMITYKNGKKVSWLYGMLVVLTFAMFYPVISGMWVNEETARLWLRWLSGWVII